MADINLYKIDSTKTNACFQYLSSSKLKRRKTILRSKNIDERDYADATALEEDFGFEPCASLREGLRRFAERSKGFYMS